MASIASCPTCAAQLAIPDHVVPSAEVQCPECAARFNLSDSVPIVLPAVRIVEKSSAAKSEPGTLPGFDLPEPASDEPQEQESPPVSPSFELPSFEPDGSSDEHVSSHELPENPPQQSSPRQTHAESSRAEPLRESLSDWRKRLKGAISQTSSTISFDSTQLSAKLAENLNLDEQIEPDVQTPEDIPLQESDLVESPPLDSRHAVDADQESEGWANEVAFLDDQPKETSGTSRRGSRRIGPRVAAVVAGPLVGVGLGLYALLWIAGPQADYLRLSQWLPQVLLPLQDEDVGTPEQELLAEGVPAAEMRVDDEDFTPEQPSEVTTRVRYDREVHTASAHQPVSTSKPISEESLQEFENRVLAADPALIELVENDLSTNQSVAKKGRAYMTLCALAERMEIIDHPRLNPRALSLLLQSKHFFRKAAGDVTGQGDLAQVVNRWWLYEQRPNQGLFLAGRIQKGIRAGEKVVYLLQLDESAELEPIPLVVDEHQFPIGSRIGAAGMIVNDAPGEIPGYDAGYNKVVESYFSFSLEAD